MISLIVISIVGKLKFKAVKLALLENQMSEETAERPTRQLYKQFAIRTRVRMSEQPEKDVNIFFLIVGVLLILALAILAAFLHFSH